MEGYRQTWQDHELLKYFRNVYCVMTNPSTRICYEINIIIYLAPSIQSKMRARKWRGILNAINFYVSQAHKVNMSHIESRPSKRSKTEYDFFVDCEEIQGPRLTHFVDALKDQALSITVHAEEGGGERYVSHIYCP